jgi:hypothetical protein
MLWRGFEAFNALINLILFEKVGGVKFNKEFFLNFPGISHSILIYCRVVSFAIWRSTTFSSPQQLFPLVQLKIHSNSVRFFQIFLSKFQDEFLQQQKVTHTRWKIRKRMGENVIRVSLCYQQIRRLSEFSFCGAARLRNGVFYKWKAISRAFFCCENEWVRDDLNAGKWREMSWR